MKLNNSTSSINGTKTAITGVIAQNQHVIVYGGTDKTRYVTLVEEIKAILVLDGLHLEGRSK